MRTLNHWLRECRPCLTVLSMLLVLLVLLGAGCLESPTVRCASGRLCPGGTACDEAHDRCVVPEQLTSCSGERDGTTCSYPGVIGGACVDGVCFPTGCGNGQIDPIEVCDDGNTLDGDGCSADCQSQETCGNEIIDTSNAEECDDGAANADTPDASCRTNCLKKRCGDGTVDSDEMCDDGNTTNRDGCTADCQSDESCGNGVIDTSEDEECDDGALNADTPDAPCRTNCLRKRCGDGTVDSDEMCDDGNTVGRDGCTADCQSDESCGNGVIDTSEDEECDDGGANADTPDTPCRTNCLKKRCGDGTVDTGEICDDSNNVNRDGCAADCASDETCGNLVIDDLVGEACDDGKHCTDGTPCTDSTECAGVGDELCKARGGDGCQENCVSPTCGDGVIDTAFNETCDDGAANSNAAPDACRLNCQQPFCGDRVKDTGETCDDGGRASGDGCSFDCLSDETCGNAYVDFAAGEQCDDANHLRHDGCDACVREQPVWTKFAAGPSARSRHAMAYDTARRRLVLFGGWGTAGHLADTWEWDGRKWWNVTPATSPQARRAHRLAYDTSRQRVVLFGGAGVIEGFASDTWEWDGTTWSNVTPSTSPPARAHHSLAYDAVRKQIVMFGGTDKSSSSEPKLGDTWTWDGSNWTARTPATSPPARQSHAMAYDAGRDRVVLSAGAGDSGLMNDTWEWDGVNWSLSAAAPAPPARSRHSITYDPRRGRVVMFGGRVSGSAPNSELWEWDGATWTNVTPAATPPGRFYSAATFSSAEAGMVVFGGRDTDDLDDTWLWDGANWSSVGPSSAPTARHSTAAAYDSGRGQIILFGGAQSGTLGDTWRWSGAGWRTLTPSTSPAPRSQHAMAYDAARDRIVLLGGMNFGGIPETWEWDGTTWSQRTPTSSPPGRLMHAMAYDALRKRVVMFGGALSFNNLEPRADTWEWDGTIWEDKTPPVSPPARVDASLAYDLRRRRMVLFGGSQAGLVDTWEWDGTIWEDKTPATSSPVWRTGDTMAFDATLGQVIMFNGSGLADTWTWDGAQWSNVSPASGPPTNSSGAVVYDSAKRQLVLANTTKVEGSPTSTWTFRYQVDNPGQPRAADEFCTTNIDSDSDGLAGCDDPDCWGYCTPSCPPLTTCAPTASRCGDGICNPFLETYAMCASDCPAPGPACGDFTCDPGENIGTCPGDCTLP